MSIQVTCPSCGWKKSFADEKEGKKTTCPECEETITIRQKRSRDEADEDYDVVDEEKPKKRKPRDDDDERPRSRSRRDEDDEDDDRPRRKKKVAARDDNNVGVKVVSGIGTVVLIIGLIILRLWLRGRL